MCDTAQYKRHIKLRNMNRQEQITTVSQLVSELIMVSWGPKPRILKAHCKLEDTFLQVCTHTHTHCDRRPMCLDARVCVCQCQFANLGRTALQTSGVMSASQCISTICCHLLSTSALWVCGHMLDSQVHCTSWLKTVTWMCHQQTLT
jgi:hypothetical protein